MVSSKRLFKCTYLGSKLRPVKQSLPNCLSICDWTFLSPNSKAHFQAQGAWTARIVCSRLSPGTTAVVSDGSSSGGWRGLTSLPAKCNANLGSRSPSAAQAAGETAAISNVGKQFYAMWFSIVFFYMSSKFGRRKNRNLEGWKTQLWKKLHFTIPFRMTKALGQRWWCANIDTRTMAPRGSAWVLYILSMSRWQAQQQPFLKFERKQTSRVNYKKYQEAWCFK